MLTLLQDLRFSLRQLRKSPGFTITAVLTLAMAIGANAVVFSVMNGLVLRPLNVPQPKTLYSIENSGDILGHSHPDYLDLRDRNRSFDDLAGCSITKAGLNTGEGPTPLWGVEASRSCPGDGHAGLASYVDSSPPRSLCESHDIAAR